MRYIRDMEERELKIVACRDYLWDLGAKEVSHQIKDGSMEAIREAAKAMSWRIGCLMTLVPVPSRNGMAEQTLLLARELERMTGCRVADIMKGRMRESLYELKKRNPEFVPGNEFFGFHTDYEGSRFGMVLLDNVYDTGATARAAAEATGIDRILVYARRYYYGK